MLEIWVIYENPTDYPGWWVVRRRCVGNGETVIDPAAILCYSLDQARSVIPQGLVCFPRDQNDDPVIVETWF